MRNLKLTVRRLTQTEIIVNEAKGGKLNDSLIDALSPYQTLIYKRLIFDFQLDESIAAFACLQTNFRSIEAVIDFLFETFDHPCGKTIMQHCFIGYNPTVGDSDDGSNVVKIGQSNNSKKLICFLCQGPQEAHL